MTTVTLDETSITLMRAYIGPVIDKLQDDLKTPGMVLTALGYMTVVTLFDAKMKPGKTKLDTFDKWVAALRLSIEKNEKLHAELTAASEAAAAREDGA